MAVGRKIVSFVDFNNFTIFFEHNHDLLVRFALDFKCIESAKLKERTKKTTYI